MKSSYCSTRVNFVIGLILYHPEESLLTRINQIVKLGFKVYVFDNSPFESCLSKIIQENTNVFYFTSGKNVGIGYSLSTLCATAYANGYSRLLFLDQDTIVSNQTLEFIESFSQSLSTDIQGQYAALVFSGQNGNDHSIHEVPFAISSGSLFNLEVLKQIGWHNENYFVDCVDYELSIRARRYGFKIGLILDTPDFDHLSEQPDQVIKLFGKSLLVRRYSVKRIKDAIGAYLKLIIGCLLRNQLSDTYLITRSMGIYFLGQILSRLTPNK